MSRGRWFALLGFVLAGSAAYALTFFPPDFIAGRGAYWKEPYGDRITNIVGLLYYIRDEWRFPLFFVPDLGFPEGSNIVFTDSLPLLALASKLVYKATGLWANYFGYWLFGCFVLLAFWAALAMRAARVEDPLAILAGVFLCISYPALLARIGHASLMGHFLIVWAFFLYLRMRDGRRHHGSVIQFGLIAVASVLLQAYFLPMVLPFLLAALVHAVAERRCTLRYAAASLVAVAAATLATIWVAGIVSLTGASPPAWGFGHFSMNVLSPLLPPREHLPDAVSRLVHWDGTGYTWDATGGQYEGYAYLGAGVLLLLAVGLVFAPRLVLQELRRHAALALCLFALAAFALSNRVYVGDWLVFATPLAEPFATLAGHFRTGGRLFWPIAYVLVVALIALVLARFKPRTARWLIGAAVVLQAFDTQLFRSRIAEHTATGYPQVLDRTSWHALVGAHRFVEQYPSFQCGGWAGKWPENNANMELHLIAAQIGKPINSSYIARPVKDCAAERELGLAFDVRPGGLYIFAGDFPVAHIAGRPRFTELCRQFRFGIACTQSWDSLRDPVLSAEFGPLRPIELPRYVYGEVLRFGIDGNGRHFMGRGWSGPEPWGTWSIGAASDIALRLASPARGSLTLSVDAMAFVHANRPRVEVDVSANGETIARWAFRDGESIVVRSAMIPRRLIGADGDLWIRFTPSSVQSPREAGLSDDRRPLGIGLGTMTLVAEPAPG